MKVKPILKCRAHGRLTVQGCSECIEYEDWRVVWVDVAETMEDAIDMFRRVGLLHQGGIV